MNMHHVHNKRNAHVLQHTFTALIHICENVPSDMCAQRLISACVSAQSNQILRCLHGETLYPWLSEMSPMQIVIILRECEW